MINQKIIWKALKAIGKYGPVVIDTGEKLRRAIRNRRKNLPEAEPLEEGNIQITQKYEQKVDMCISSLRQHVKVINRNSNALKEYAKTIDEMAARSEEVDILVDAMSRLITVLIWTTGISFVIAVVAVCVALFK